MSPKGITGPRTEVHEIRGISFDWPAGPNAVTFCRAPTRSVRDIRCRKPVLPRKVGQSHARSPDLSLIGRPYTSFYRHSVYFDSRLLRFRDITGFVSQMLLLHVYPSFFTQNLETFPYSQTDEQYSAMSQVHWLIGRDVTFRVGLH